MNTINKDDQLTLTKVFLRKIGLLFLFVIALYFDGTHFASIYPHAQLVTNCFMIVFFFILYYRSVKRTRELMIYGVILGFMGEYLFSILLNMYTYRLENLPLYIPFGHAAVYARTFSFSKNSTVRKHQAIITKWFSIIIISLATIYLLLFKDIFGFVMTIGVFVMLIKRPKDRVFFLTMYIVVAVLEIGGTAYSTWSWPSTAFGIFTFLESNNPPSGISLFYFLLDIGCFVLYTQINKTTWQRYQLIHKGNPKLD